MHCGVIFGQIVEFLAVFDSHIDLLVVLVVCSVLDESLESWIRLRCLFCNVATANQHRTNEHIVLILRLENRTSRESVGYVMSLAGSPQNPELVTNELAHDAMDPQIVDGIHVFAVEYSDERLVIRDHGEVGTG